MKINEKVFIIAFIILLTIAIGSSISSTIQSYKSRRLCNQLREQLYNATDTNRRLGETVERCQAITGELGEITQRNIRTSRDAIELIEQIREGVSSLEVELGYFDFDKYYSYWDNEFGLSKE